MGWRGEGVLGSCCFLFLVLFLVLVFLRFRLFLLLVEFSFLEVAVGVVVVVFLQKEKGLDGGIEGGWRESPFGWGKEKQNAAGKMFLLLLFFV